MTTWSLVDETADITAHTGTPGEEPLKLFVATAVDWNDKTRLVASNDEHRIELSVNFANLNALIAVLEKARNAHADYMGDREPAPEDAPLIVLRRFGGGGYIHEWVETAPESGLYNFPPRAAAGLDPLTFTQLMDSNDVPFVELPPIAVADPESLTGADYLNAVGFAGQTNWIDVSSGEGS